MIRGYRERIITRMIKIEQTHKEMLIENLNNTLLEIFSTIDDNKLTIIKPLINKAAFMSVTLDELQDNILKSGISETYKNGANQYGNKESTEIRVYNSMIKNYHNVVKQLLDLLPPDSSEYVVGTSLLEFANR